MKKISSAVTFYMNRVSNMRLTSTESWQWTHRHTLCGRRLVLGSGIDCLNHHFKCSWVGDVWADFMFVFVEKMSSHLAKCHIKGSYWQQRYPVIITHFIILEWHVITKRCPYTRYTITALIQGKSIGVKLLESYCVCLGDLLKCCSINNEYQLLFF